MTDEHRHQSAHFSFQCWSHANSFAAIAYAFGSFFNLVSIFLKWYSLYYYQIWRRFCFMALRRMKLYSLYNVIMQMLIVCFFLPTWIIIMASLKLKLMQHFRFPGANRKRCWENNFNIRTKCAIPNVYNLKWC